MAFTGRLLTITTLLAVCGGVVAGWMAGWDPALWLFVLAGAALLALAALVAAGRYWLDQWTMPRWAVAFALAAAGLAAAGAGLESIDRERLWSALMLPAIVTGGMWFLGVALDGRRARRLHRANPEDSYWAMRAGCLMFGVTWPLFGLWALDLV